MIKVIVISDIKIYCEGMSRILASTNPIEVISSENNFNAAMASIEQDLADVILLDMTMKGSCLIARQIMKLCPETKIVALAVPEDEQNIVECAQAGIAGYVPREASVDELIATIISISKGEFRCPSRIAACIFNKIHDLACNAKNTNIADSGCDNQNPLSGLTVREQQIINLMAKGLSNKLISRDINIEVSTVKNHVHNILVKLDVKSRAQAVSLLRRSHREDSNSSGWPLLSRIPRY